MKKQNIFYIFSLVLIFLSCLLYYRTHINKILHPNDYFLSCTDFGQYLLEIQDYSRENTYFKDLFKVGEDPGFFVLITNLLRISNIPLGSILSLFSMFMYCLVGMVLFLMGVKLANKNEFFTGIICVILYISFYGNINANFSGIWRQIMGHIFFLLFLFSFCQKKNSGYTLVGVLFLSMAILTHRIFFLIGMVTLLGNLGYSFFYDKKFFKKNVYIFLLTLFLCFPYFIYFLGYIRHYIEYLMSQNSTQQIEEGLKYRGPKYLGFSFYGPNDGTTPIIQYFQYQGYILVAVVAFLRKTFKKIDGLYTFVFLFLLAYVSLRIDFAARVLLVFELIITPLIAINTINYSKYQKLLIILSIFLIGFSLISKVRLQRIASQKIDINEGINFLYNHVNKKENHFIMGSVCVGDLMSQLGYTNHFSFHMSLARVREAKANQELDFGDLETLVLANIYYLKRDGTLLDIFKGKSVYLVFIDTDKSEVDLIQQGKSGLLNKKYLTLIYPQNPKIPGAGKIKYIFKIENNLISYADVKTYITQNVDDLNLNINN